MINRTLIRLKVIQILYSYFLRESNNVDAAEKELHFSLSKAFDMYNFLLALMPEIMFYAQNRIEVRRTKMLPTEEDLNPNMRFVENTFIKQLAVNEQLAEHRKHRKHSWRDYERVVQSLFEKIEQSSLYADYMNAPSTSYDEDRDFWRKIYKQFIANNEDLDELFEGISLYWNDDKDIVDSFVLKTIKRFEEKNGARQPLLNEFRDEEDRSFAVRLLRRSILNEPEYGKLIDGQSKNWDKDRICYMDRVILTAAIAEVMSFPSIPVSVTINEYVEIAKYYSTPKSSSYVNGMLDAIVKQLRKDGKLQKDGQ